MNIKNIFFHIHYCNGRKVTAQRNYPGQVARTLNHHLLALVIEGNGRIIIDKKSFRLKSGMLCYIAPNVQHSIEPDPENPARFLTVHFSYTYVNYSDGKWDINDSPQILPLNPVQEITDGYNTENIFKRLVDTWNTKQPGYEFLSKTLFQQLLIAIYQNVRKQ
ncbi:MAG TPA: AraC family ligand binding domain-containing protein, partial [Ruminiclostridium sp.]|nr:AraC family ligand binding domain-containing protein [Ruminiclostridium sp.]